MADPEPDKPDGFDWQAQSIAATSMPARIKRAMESAGILTLGQIYETPLGANCFLGLRISDVVEAREFVARFRLAEGPAKGPPAKRPHAFLPSQDDATQCAVCGCGPSVSLHAVTVTNPTDPLDGARCDACRFFTSDPREESGSVGQCRIRSVVTDDFPLRNASEWCGEFSRRRD